MTIEAEMEVAFVPKRSEFGFRRFTVFPGEMKACQNFGCGPVGSGMGGLADLIAVHTIVLASITDDNNTVVHGGGVL